MSSDHNQAVQLILGGARSGKSRMAEQVAKDSNKSVVYIATATIYDQEMQQRVDRHINDRPQHWLTVEEPLQLAHAISQHSQPNTCIVVDCLTLWLTNILMSEMDESAAMNSPAMTLADHKRLLLAALASAKGQVILVSNEVGQGIVPLGELSRRFVDEAGWLHQEIAQVAQQVTMVIAGLPMRLK